MCSTTPQGGGQGTTGLRWRGGLEDGAGLRKSASLVNLQQVLSWFPSPVTVEGNILGAMLVGESGEEQAVGNVPAGRYTTRVPFPDGATIAVPDLVVVEPGRTVTVRCDEHAQQCR